MSTALFPTDERTAMMRRSARSLLVTTAFASLASAPIHFYESYFSYPWVVATIISLLLGVIGVKDWYRNKAGKITATLCLFAWLGCSILSIPDRPGRGLFMLLALVSLVAYIWPPWRILRVHFAGKDGAEREDLLISTLVALFIGIDKWQTTTNEFFIQAVALSCTFAVPALRAFRFPPKGKIKKPLFYFMLAVSLFLAFSPVISNKTIDQFFDHFTLAPVGLFAPLLVISVLGWKFMLKWFEPLPLATATHGVTDENGTSISIQNRRTSKTLLDAILTNPARVLVISFVFICVSGTVLLHLPLSSAKIEPLSWIDAGFTSVSATCVTGLTVINPIEDLSGFGQFILLSLIQIGGLGIMVFSSAAILLLGGRLSMSSERAAVDMVGANSRSDLVRAVMTVLIVTVATEAISALILFLSFVWAGEPVWFSLWKGIFTAISAFCNAGFALNGDSLVSYNHNPLIINTVGFTIAIGGLGPPVLISALFWKQIKQRTLHAKIVILTTLALIFIPGFLFLIFEWNTSLADFGIIDKMTNALFQSVTLRTAGFNSIDLTHMRPISWTIMEVVMFIGGSPGSTAGGIKTTTMAVIVLGIVSVIKGEDKIEIFGRTIPHVTVLRASAIVTLGFLFFIFALTAIQLTQTLDLQTGMFEVISAMATVGLSLDGTSKLDEIGMLIIMGCMFAGRVGPMSLFVFFASGDNKHRPKRYPEEDLPVG